METNHQDLLYFESEKSVYEIKDDDALKNLSNTFTSYDSELFFKRPKMTEGLYPDFLESIGLSFLMHSQYLYGLPERAERILLKATDYT